MTAGPILWLLFGAAACGGERSAADSSASAATSAPPEVHASATPSASVAPSSATPSASTAGPTPTPDEFCARAVALGEKNMEKCADSEKANVPEMDKVKSLGAAPKECAMRVSSKNVEFHPDVAARCLEAAEKLGGKTTFFSFHRIPECHGVVTGKAAAGQPALYAEECAPGTAMFKNRCVAPVAKNTPCPDHPAGLLGVPSEHPRCEAGLDCFMTFSTSDGYPSEFACMPPQELGARCKLDLNQCPPGSSCYQGKCRALAEAGGACMQPWDCAAGLSCEIPGGVFGTCVSKAPVVETCGSPSR